MEERASSYSKIFARRLMLGIDSECITYRDYIPWADHAITELKQPDLWICDLSTVEYRPAALKILAEFVYSEPFEQFRDEVLEYLGFLWIRYKRREISWATFLREAGDYTDGNGEYDCEEFYADLNELEKCTFDVAMEARQVLAWKVRLQKGIDASDRFYAEIQKG